MRYWAMPRSTDNRNCLKLANKRDLAVTCQHLRKLYQLCQEHDLKITSSDIVRITCRECEEIEVCPTTLTDEYDARLEQKSSPEQKDSHQQQTK